MVARVAAGVLRCSTPQYPAPLDETEAPQPVQERFLRLLLNHYVMSFGMYWSHRALHDVPYLLRIIYIYKHVYIQVLHTNVTYMLYGAGTCGRRSTRSITGRSTRSRATPTKITGPTISATRSSATSSRRSWSHWTERRSGFRTCFAYWRASRSTAVCLAASILPTHCSSGCRVRRCPTIMTGTTRGTRAAITLSLRSVGFGMSASARARTAGTTRMAAPWRHGATVSAASFATVAALPLALQHCACRAQ